MSSAYSELMSLLYRFLTPAEINRVRLAIEAGARGFIRGKYTTDQVERTAERICILIEGAHIKEVRAYENDTGEIFVDKCKELLTRAVYEEAMRTTSPYTLFMEREESKLGRREGVELF